MKKKLLPLLCIQFILITSVKSSGLTLPYATGFDSPAEKAGWNIYRTGVLSQYSWGYSGGGFSGQCVSHDYNVGGASTDTVVDWFVSPAMNFSSTGTVALKVNTSGFSTPFRIILRCYLVQRIRTHSWKLYSDRFIVLYATPVPMAGYNNYCSFCCWQRLHRVEI